MTSVDNMYVHATIKTPTTHTAITYAGGWSACAIHAAHLAPPGLEVTSQAIFQGLWLGLGGGLAGLVGGRLYASLGAHWLFRGSGMIVGAGGVLLLLVGS